MPTGYERIRNSDRVGAAAPGAETLRELIGEGPVLILIDELSIYLRKTQGSGCGQQAAEQLTPFLTDLIKAVNASPQAVLVFTLALGRGGQAVDAYGDENQRIDRIFAELQSVSRAGRSRPLTPTSEDETVQVLCPAPVRARSTAAGAGGGRAGLPGDLAAAPRGAAAGGPER